MTLNISIQTNGKKVDFSSMLDHEMFEKAIEFKTEKDAKDFVEVISKAFETMTTVK